MLPFVTMSRNADRFIYTCLYFQKETVNGRVNQKLIKWKTTEGRKAREDKGGY